MKESNMILNKDTSPDGKRDTSLPDNWLQAVMQEETGQEGKEDTNTSVSLSNEALFDLLCSNMSDIKHQGRQLQLDIRCVKAKFLEILKNFGLENELSSFQSTGNVTMTTPNGGSKLTTPRRPQDPSEITHYDYADILLDQLLSRCNDLSSSSSSSNPNSSNGGGSVNIEPGSVGSEGQLAAEDDVSDTDNTAVGQDPGSSAAPAPQGAGHVSVDAMRQIAREVVSSMTLEYGPQVRLPPRAPQEHQGEVSSSTAVPDSQSKAPCAVGQDPSNATSNVVSEGGEISLPSVGEKQPPSATISSIRQALQNAGTPNGVSNVRGGDGGGSGPGSSDIGRSPRRSTPFASEQSPQFSPFTSAKAQRLLGPRLAPDLRRNLAAEASWECDETAEENGNDTGPSDSMLATGRIVLGTEMDETSARLPVGEDSCQCSLASQASLTPCSCGKGAETSDAKKDDSNDNNNNDNKNNNDAFPSSEGSSNFELKSVFASGGLQSTAPYKTPSSDGENTGSSKLSGTNPTPVKTSLWSSENISPQRSEDVYTPERVPGANQENIAPGEHQGSDESSSLQEESDIIEPPLEFRGPILSLEPNITESDLAFPRLVLREITSSSNNTPPRPLSTGTNNHSTTSSSPPNTTSSSDGYPRSSTTTTSYSDNAAGTEMDKEKEMQSRMKYYSDFTVDRQRKINRMRRRRVRTQEKADDGSPGDEMMTRHVEGAEKMDVFQRIAAMPPRVGTACPNTPSTVEESSSGGSTLRKTKRSLQTMRSGERTGSSHASSRGSSSHPLFHSTMIVDSEAGGTSCPSEGGDGTERGSVYTWSLEEDGEQVDLEESYLRSCKRPRHRRHYHQAPTSPSTPSNRRQRQAAAGATKHSPLAQRRASRLKRSPRRVLSYSPSLHLSGMVSAIQHSSGDGGLLGLELGFSSNEDVDRKHLTPSMPRTSTRLSLHPPTTEGPDPLSVSVMSGVHPLPDSTRDSPPLPERLPVPGMSSNSEEHTSSGAGGGPPSGAAMRLPAQHYLGGSALSYSPETVDSSGLFAPCNSYNSPASVASHCGLTSPSGSVTSSDNNGPHAPPPTPPKAPDTVFKIPAPPVSSAYRRRTASHRENIPWTPSGSSRGSLQSEPVMSRKLFTPVTAYTPGGTKYKDKRALMRKIKKFSKNFYKKDRGSGSDTTIRTLANL